jgi:3-deoxy-D-manno-octulosonic acid (KDO) 8-phosphate synthase
VVHLHAGQTVDPGFEERMRAWTSHVAWDAATGVTAVEALRLATQGHEDAAEQLARAAADAGASAMTAAWVASLPDAGDAVAYLAGRPV